jgi:hypothetical protein
MGFADWFAPRVTPAEVRAEVWSLGVRHHGVGGAEAELAAGASDGARANLLRACVRTLRRG